MTVTASPILMTPAQAKEWMPPTTIITAQADMIRDQGQQFAKLLQTSGVACGVVQEVACIHDCEFEDFARDSETSKLVMLMVTAKIKEVLIEPDMNGEQHGDAEDDDLNGQIGVVKGGSHKRKRRS
jgi:acetyl esterase/lipase